MFASYVNRLGRFFASDSSAARKKQARRRDVLAIEPLEERMVLTAVALFDNNTFVDAVDTTINGSTSLSEALNMQATLQAQGDDVTTFSGTSASDIQAALAGQQVLVIPELENGDLAAALDDAAKTVIADFVAAGGGLIVEGSSTSVGRAAVGNLLNSVFGFNVSTTDEVTYIGSMLTSAASGTSFAGDPSILMHNDATSGITTSSLPTGSTSIYSALQYSTVATMSYGSGKIGFLGWDWYNAAPRGTADGGWLDVLHDMVNEVEAPTPPTTPSGDAPVITLGGSSGQQTDAQNQVFTWNVSDAASVEVDIFKNGNLIGSSNNAQGQFDFNAYGVGDFTISVQAAGAGGQSCSSCGAVTVVDDDTQAPTIGIDQQNGVFSWVVSDAATGNSGLANVNVVITQDTGNGAVVVYSQTTTDQAPGTPVGGSFDFAKLGPGQFQINVTAVDGDADFAGDGASSSATAAATGVSMDLRPNTINPDSNGNVTLTVYSTSVAAGGAVNFDASTIDVSTIHLGDPTLSGYATPLQTKLQDMNGDGTLDLVAKFSVSSLRDSGAISAATSDALFSALTVDGHDIVGSDAVKVVSPQHNALALYFDYLYQNSQRDKVLPAAALDHAHAH